MRGERRLGGPRSLTGKLALVLLVAGVLLAGWQGLQLGPWIEREFQRSASALVDLGRRDLGELSSHDIARSRDVLVDVIDHATDARQRSVLDLPLELYRQDPDALRAALIADERQRGTRLRQNAQVLAREMSVRSTRRIDGWLEELRAEQRTVTARFGRDLRNAHLWTSVAWVAVLIGMLGLGLYTWVIRPVRDLRAATRSVASGELDVELPAARRADEIGALAADFSTMVADLRRSRAELDRLNQNLEHEVARKTAHLERAQRQLVHAEKMSSIGTLAGGVAHEFNNLIGGIRGCTAELLAEADEPDQREPLEIILRAADRASAITAQLLHFSRQRVGHKVATDLGAIVREALVLVAPRARQLGVEIESEIGEMPVVEVDRDAFHQVFLNLFTNALQAMADENQRRLTVRGGRTSTAPDLLFVEVEDTGCGIAPAALDRIFEPFYSSKTDQPDPARRGSGLGLSVSYGIVQAHGGTLTVRSPEGEGACFRLELPIEPAADDPAVDNEATP